VEKCGKFVFSSVFEFPLPHFSFKSLNAFVQAIPHFGKTQSGQKSFVAHTRRPEPVLSTALKCSARMGNVRHPCRTRVSKAYLLNYGTAMDSAFRFKLRAARH
jgi:hypothetical protein